MNQSVDYYFAPQSPWAYLGHQRFERMTGATGTAVRVLPCDLASIFGRTGGVPLAQRPVQRRNYRLLELRRFSESLGIPLKLEPAFFPVDPALASHLIVAASLREGAATAMRLTEGIMRAVWSEDRNIADAQVLAAVLRECELDAALLEAADAEDVKAAYAGNTAQAFEAGVFGSPSYVFRGELFWGQDRLDFLERALNS